MKLSPIQSQNREVIELQVFEFTVAYPVGLSYLNAIRLLATFGEVESVGTSTREIEKLALSIGTVFMALSCTGKRRKTSKPPRFTKTGQEPRSFCKALEEPPERTKAWTRRHGLHGSPLRAWRT